MRASVEFQMDKHSYTTDDNVERCEKGSQICLRCIDDIPFYNRDAEFLEQRISGGSRRVCICSRTEVEENCDGVCSPLRMNNERTEHLMAQLAGAEDKDGDFL